MKSLPSDQSRRNGGAIFNLASFILSIKSVVFKLSCPPPPSLKLSLTPLPPPPPHTHPHNKYFFSSFLSRECLLVCYSTKRGGGGSAAALLSCLASVWMEADWSRWKGKHLAFKRHRGGKRWFRSASDILISRLYSPPDPGRFGIWGYLPCAIGICGWDFPGFLGLLF